MAVLNYTSQGAYAQSINPVEKPAKTAESTPMQLCETGGGRWLAPAGKGIATCIIIDHCPSPDQALGKSYTTVEYMGVNKVSQNVVNFDCPKHEHASLTSGKPKS